MTYAGTTSTSPNVPALVEQVMAGPRTWSYTSTHVSSDISSTGFFVDGRRLGMVVGDRFIHTGSTTYLTSHHVVLQAGSSGASVSTGSTL